MNPISYAIDQIHLKIPRDILDRTFLPNVHYQYAVPVSVSSRIREEIIERRVKVDCNLIGGIEADIPLSSVVTERVDAYNTIYRIPKSLTQGKTITRALNLTFGEGSVLGTSHLGLRRSNPMLDAAGGVLNSHLPIPNVSTAYVQLIGENTLLVRENYSLPRNVFLKCWLEHDEEMNHLQPTTYKPFAQLCLYATQSYCYNTLIIRLDRGAIFAGADLGSIKDIVDSYSDAEENYETFFKEQWRKQATHLNDPQAKMRHIKMITGGLH